MPLWRFLVRTKPGCPDPAGIRAARTLSDFGVASPTTVRHGRVYLAEFPHCEDQSVLARRVADELLTDAVSEDCQTGDHDHAFAEPEDALVIEVYFKPGVMDTVALSTAQALRDLGIETDSVRTGVRYEIVPQPDDRDIPKICRLLANECIHDVSIGTRPLAPAPEPPVYRLSLRRVEIRGLDDAGLERLSREGHLFLSLAEMRAIQDHYRDRDPTDLEIETLAQTWSEHCIHKTFKSAILYRGAPFPQVNQGILGGQSAFRLPPSAPASKDDSRTGQGDATNVDIRYDNLLADTIARATDELIAEGRGPECLSVFKDNAGIIGFDDEFGVAFKVETHNHPSAIEPYGGAATGVGGCIRDILGCGLGAKPIANTDVFCVAPPDWPVDAVPKGVIHPRTVLQGIVSGVRDYGNCMGIPTVNGAVNFDPRYLGNPLVYCGCVGVIPRDRIDKAARPGDAIVLIGGRTGRDGIHGATFSSAELTDTHTDEFAHAVQIGNPIEEKKVLDIILQARDFAPTDGTGFTEAGSDKPAIQDRRCLFSAITDCGAGGLSSAVGEMGEDTGAEVHLDRVPLKYAGLRYDEIWISEAQERMVLAVPPDNVDTFLALAGSEDVEATVIGRFTDTRRLVLYYDGTEVGDLDMAFLHDGLPKQTRQAEWWPTHKAAGAPASQKPAPPGPHSPDAVLDELRRRLADPTTASKHWLIRQYDHEVQGRSVIKPLVGPGQGPSDAAVIRPRLDSDRGIAVGCGLAPDLYDEDPYWMAVAAIDEALRNVVCVGGDPARTAILDNFCWPRVDNKRNLGALVRACQACYDVAKAYGLPFISGKDSLNNEFALDRSDVDLVRRVLQERDGCVPRPRSRGRADDRSTDAIHDNRLAIPGTLLISAVSIIDDVRRCVSADLKHDSDSCLFLIGEPSTFPPAHRPGSRDDTEGGRTSTIDAQPDFDLALAARIHGVVYALIGGGIATAAHDVSDGGILVTVAEMAIAGDRGCVVTQHIDYLAGERPDENPWRKWTGGGAADFLFDASPALYVVETPADRLGELLESLMKADLPCLPIGFTGTAAGRQAESGGPRLEIAIDDEQPASSIPLADLRSAWKTPLDW